MSDDEKSRAQLNEMVETTDLPPDPDMQSDYENLIGQAGGASGGQSAQVEIAAPAVGPAANDGKALKVSCHNCGQRVDLTELEPFSSVLCPTCGVELVVPKWFGNYLLEEICGIGGMATVYRALDVVLDREVAIKVLSDTFASDMNVSQVFLHEARAAAAISHAGVIPIYTLGVNDGKNYIVMQYMEGGSLEKVLQEADGPLPVYSVVEWIRDVAAGLECASRSNVIHHDIKPANIMLDAEGKAKIGDFGIAQIANKDATSSFRSWVSPDYVSPEKLQTGKEDSRGDIYSLGATFYHLITGMTPFNNPDLDELLRARLVSTPMAPCLHRKDVPKKISDLILAMLAVDPEQRPTYLQIVKLLTEYLENPEKASGAAHPVKPGVRSAARPRPGVKRTAPGGAAGVRTAQSAQSSPRNVARKKQKSKLLVLITLLFNVVLFLVTAIILVYILDHFRRIDMLAEYLPQFMQMKKKSTDAELPLNTKLINAFQSGLPDEVIKNGDEYLRDPSKARRMQGALQMAFAVYLNGQKDAEEYCCSLWKSYDKNLSFCDKIVYEDNLLVIAYLGGMFETTSDVYKAFRFYQNGKPVCGMDFNAKLTFAKFFRSFYNNKPAYNEQAEMLSEIKLILMTFQTIPNWLFNAFNDRYLYWEQVIMKKTGVKEDKPGQDLRVEPLFVPIIEIPTAKWDFKEPAKKMRRPTKPAVVGSAETSDKRQTPKTAPIKRQTEKERHKAQMKEEGEMMSNVATLEPVPQNFTRTDVDRDDGFRNFDVRMTWEFLEQTQKRLKRPHPKNPFKFFGVGEHQAERQQKYLAKLSETDAAVEKEFITRMWNSFKPMLKREMMFKSPEPFVIDNSPFVFKAGSRFRVIAGSTPDAPYILRVQRLDGAFSDCKLEDCPYATIVLLFRAYAKERNGYTLPRVKSGDAAMRHALRLEMHERAAAYLNLALLFAWYGDPENCYDAIKRAANESIDVILVREIKKFLLPPAENGEKAVKNEE